MEVSNRPGVWRQDHKPGCEAFSRRRARWVPEVPGACFWPLICHAYCGLRTPFSRDFNLGGLTRAPSMLNCGNRRFLKNGTFSQVTRSPVARGGGFCACPTSMAELCELHPMRLKVSSRTPSHWPGPGLSAIDGLSDSHPSRLSTIGYLPVLLSERSPPRENSPSRNRTEGLDSTGETSIFFSALSKISSARD